MFSPVASTIFAYRNAEKTKNGDVGRSVVTVGQCTGVFKEVAKYDNIFATSARSALKAFEEVAKDNKALGYAGKCLKFTADNVNPLICGSAVLKVAMADDKVHDGIVEATALTGMFAGECFMKDNFNNVFSESAFKNVATKLKNKNVLKGFADAVINSRYTGKVASVLKGLLFVGGSMTSYAIAEKGGEHYAESIMNFFGIPQKAPKIDTKNQKMLVNKEEKD